MVVLDVGEVLGTIRDILIFLIPIALLVLGFLVRKGIVSKDNAEKAETVIRVLTGAVDAFKKEDKPASKSLTELIGAKAQGEKVSGELEGYLKKFNLNG